MTRRQHIINVIASHLLKNNVHPYDLTQNRIQEALSDNIYTYEDYDWVRLYKAIARKHYDLHFYKTEDMKLSTEKHPLL